MFTTGKKAQIEQLKEESKNFMIQQGILTLGYSIDQLERIQTLLMKKMVDGPDKINDPVEALKLSMQEFEQEQKAFQQEQFNKLMGNMVFDETTGMVSSMAPGGGGAPAPSPAPAPAPVPAAGPNYDKEPIYTYDSGGALKVLDQNALGDVRSSVYPYLPHGGKKRTKSKKRSKKNSKKNSKKRSKKNSKKRIKSNKRKNKRR